MIENVLNVWGGGQILAFSGVDGKTDFDEGLILRTSVSSFAFDIKHPGIGRIRFKGSPSVVCLAGDFFIFDSIGVRGAFVDAHHFLIEGDCEIEHDGRLAGVRKDGKLLVGVARFFSPALVETDVDNLIKLRAKWLEGISIPKDLPEKRRRTLYKAISQMKTQVYSPEGRIRHRWTTPDRWPHRQMWLWDSAFHAAGFRRVDADLARDAVLALFDTQREDGMMPHMMSPFSSSNITQPPIIALGVKLINEVAPSPEMIGALYPKLKKYIEWDLDNRDSDGAGLCEWLIEGVVNCRCGESGMDNSPRFDGAAMLDAVDFNSYLALECEIMARFAETCGRGKDASLWEKRRAKLCALINERLWSEERGFYFDCDPAGGRQSDVYAVSGFLPLICGAPSRAQAEKLVAHLENPGTFGTPFRVPSVARCCEKSYSKDMWRGPVWVSMNWLIILGLRRYGFLSEARRLADETMGEIEDGYLKYGTLFEFYDDRKEVDPPMLLRKGRNAPEISPYHQAFSDYGWTATLYVDLAFGGPGG